MSRVDASKYPRRADVIVLAVFLPLSLILTAMTNRVAGQVLNSAAPAFAWIATTAFPSCLLIAGLYAAFGSKDALHWLSPNALDRRQVVGLSLGWLSLWIGGSLVYAILTGHWTTYAHGWPSVTAFLIFGPLGEELLFREIIFGSARRAWPASPVPAIVLSTVAFSLHHISINTAPQGLAVAQILFTIPMGIVFSLLRDRSSSIWPGFFVHVATNFPSIF